MSHLRSRLIRLAAELEGEARTGLLQILAAYPKTEIPAQISISLNGPDSRDDLGVGLLAWVKAYDQYTAGQGTLEPLDDFMRKGPWKLAKHEKKRGSRLYWLRSSSLIQDWDDWADASPREQDKARKAHVKEFMALQRQLGAWAAKQSRGHHTYTMTTQRW